MRILDDTGKQTMGEEYCDILQVYKGEGAGPVPVKFYHRTLLFILRVIFPYALQRLTMKYESTNPTRRRYFRERRSTLDTLPQKIWHKFLQVQDRALLYMQERTQELSTIADKWLPFSRELSSKKIVQVENFVENSVS